MSENSNLPVKNFCLPELNENKINKPYCKCEVCDRIIDEVNFYHCPKVNCLVKPAYTIEMMERMISGDLLKKLKTVQTKKD